MPHLTVSVPISDSRLIDLLVGAVEGGSNYWASFTAPLPNGIAYTSIRCREHEAHTDSTPAVDTRVSASDLLRGLQRMAAQPAGSRMLEHLTNVINANDDAETADVVLQMTLFGEVIYG